MRAALILLIGAFILAGCQPAPAETNYFAAITEAGSAEEIEEAIPRLENHADLRDGEPSQYVVSAHCPTGTASISCAVDVAIRASAWLNAGGSPPEELVVNINLGRGGQGYQLVGKTITDDRLAQMTEQEALGHFAWNDGSYAGKDAAALYCLEGNGQRPFCQRLADAACKSRGPAALIRFCRAHSWDG